MDLTTSGPLVLQTLVRACSQTADVLKPAEQQLKEWETQPGFYSILMSIYMDHTIDVNARWLAVLYMKNGVDRYWRKNAPNAISEEEKISLKQRLISNFNEPVNQIALQVAVLVGKIARLDCPRNWQELIPTLLNAVRCEDFLLRQRALLTLHHVAKTLASKRLAHDRKVFEELTSNVFGFMLELWQGHTQRLFDLLVMTSPSNLLPTTVAMDNSLLTLKVLRKMVVYGFPEPHKAESAVIFITKVFQRIDDFLRCKNQLQAIGSHDLLQKREKVITLLTKVLLDSQEMHSESFIQFIQPSLEMAVRYNFMAEGSDILYERFTVNTFNLMRSILRSEAYRPAKTVEETKNPMTLTAYRIKMGFFTTDTLTEICRRLILHYFLLSWEDLECWDTDPEEFISDAGGDGWKFSLRPCTENLYLTLFKEFRETLTPVVVDLVKEQQGQVDASEVDAILKRDAVYNAVGLASFDLYDEIDFNQWLTNHLLQELQVKHTNYRIIRRRVIWLMGCWVGVKLSNNLRPVLYESVLTLLSQSEDLVVRIEAANTLRLAVDDFEFKADQFHAYLESSFSMLFQLLKDVQECETKMQVLHVMSFVIERMEMSIRPYAEGLIHYLPGLWEESADHNMLRCAILTTLVNLVEGLGTLCVSMYDLLLPVIQLSTDVTHESHVYLMEDGLDLWHVTLHCSPAMTPQLLNLYTNMPGLMEYGSESLRVCLKITESYVLLGRDQFMQRFSDQLTQSLCGLFGDLRSEGIVMVMKLVEIIFKVFPEDGPRVFAQLLPRMFKSVVDEEHYPMETAMYLCLMGRIILQNQTFFLESVENLAQSLNQQSADVLGVYLDTWFEKMDNIMQPERKKLCGMAACSLISTKLGVVLERFGGIINLCVEILHDVCRLEGDKQLDVLVITGSSAADLPDDITDTEHEKRKRQLSYQDPIHTVSMKDFVVQQLARCQQQHGEVGFQKLMDLVDCEIAQQLQEFIQPGR